MIYILIDDFADRKGEHMEMLAVKIIIGVIIGVVCKYICSWLEEYILKKRNLEVYTSKLENITVLIVAMIVGAVIMIRFRMVVEIVYTFLILIICLLVSVIDLHHRIIPNKLLLAMLIIKLGIGIPGLLGVGGFPKFNAIYSLIGLVVGFVVFMIPAMIGKAVGAGDVKLAATIGFCLGVDGLLYSVVLMGGLVLVFAMVQKNKTLRNMLYEMIPMGPFMALSTIVVMILR